MVKYDKISNPRVEELILLHLRNFNHLRNDYIVSESLTEQGIQQLFGYNLGHISRVIKNLEQKELIFRLLKRIDNKNRKQNTFFLTDEGLKAATELLKLYNEIKVFSKENSYTQKQIYEFMD